MNSGLPEVPTLVRGIALLLSSGAVLAWVMHGETLPRTFLRRVL